MLPLKVFNVRFLKCISCVCLLSHSASRLLLDASTAIFGDISEVTLRTIPLKASSTETSAISDVDALGGRQAECSSPCLHCFVGYANPYYTARNANQSKAKTRAQEDKDILGWHEALSE